MIRSGVIAFIALLALTPARELWTPPGMERVMYEPEVLLVLPFLYAVVTVVAMGIANVLYLLVPLVESLVRPRNPEPLRRRLFALGIGAAVIVAVLPALGAWVAFLVLFLIA